MKRLLLTLFFAALPCAVFGQAVGNGAAGQTFTAPTVVQSASASANAGNATVSFGSTPTTGNLLLFMCGGHNDLWTYPNTSGVYPLTSYMTTGTLQQGGGSGTNLIGSSEEVMAFYRVVQGGDGKNWVFGNSGDTISCFGFELNGAGSVQAVSLINLPNNGATATVFGVPPISVPANGIGFAAFESDDAAGVTSICSGWTNLGYLFPAGHGHATQYMESATAMTTGILVPCVTYTNTSTTHPSAIEEVTVFGH